MKLSKRLSAIFDLFSGEIAADVGSDHGKLIISLFEQGKIKKGYAIDNKKGPFTRLKQEIENHNIINNVIPMLSDGISELPNDVDSVIIAGMGGHLIVNILQSHQEKLSNVQRIFVDAHNGLYEVRKNITELGYHISKEQILLEDGIYYEIIEFEKGAKDCLSDDECEYGPFLIKEKSPIFIQKHKERIAQIEKIISEKDIPEERRNNLLEEKRRLESIL